MINCNLPPIMARIFRPLNVGCLSMPPGKSSDFGPDVLDAPSTSANTGRLVQG